MVLRSPIFPESEIEIVKTINVDRLEKEYKNQLNIEVSRFFKGMNTLDLYRCKTTGYMFYYPLNLSGDGEFYEELAHYPWYYMPFKWEHSVSMNLIKRTDKILEVGCGEGEFIKRVVNEVGCEAYGVELNQAAVSICLNKGLQVFHLNLDDFAKENEGKFDLACSFQVLEHLSNPMEFLESKIKTLKKGGRLIIGVPNNNSFIREDNFNILNMPPHHMGLWSDVSLASLTSFLPLKLISLKHEPLQEYHLDWYIKVYLKKMGKGIEKVTSNNFSKYLLRKLITPFKKKIKGHTILAVYEKV